MISDYTVLGIDIGSVAASVAVMDSKRKLLFTDYAFHRGNIKGTVCSLLKNQDFSQINFIAATSSTPSSVKVFKRYNNQMAVITAAKKHHPAMAGLLIVGGEKYSFSSFDSTGHYLGSTTNTSCAAGTGSFLDQQANRLKINGIEELANIACSCTGECPQIASRCAVFAKTDLIHAQQEGYQLDEISDGLCRGLAKNIVDTLFSSKQLPHRKIVFCGGVAKNKAVASHIRELTGLTLTIPRNGHLYGAMGACLLHISEIDEGDDTSLPADFTSVDQLFKVSSSHTRQYFYPPLQLHLSTYPDFQNHTQYRTRKGNDGMEVEVDLYQPHIKKQKTDIFLGIDIGSTSTKAVLMDTTGEVIAGFYTRTAGRPLLAVQNLFFAIDELQQKTEVAFNIIQCGTTGSGRKFIGKLIGADAIIDEITAHARAAAQLNPEVDTIIEIGGQDAKFTTLKDGRVTFSTMNNVCAAGTGSFIEEQAAKLGCPVEEYSARAENLSAPMTSDRCTVFMERDMNHFLSEGYDINEVLASALHSVRENYLLKVATEKNIGKTISFQGATAKNKALVAAFEQRLQKPIFVSRYCHLTGALGTSLILRDEKRTETGFTGIDLYKKEIPVISEACDLCTNHCKITVATIDSQKVAYGFLCGRDYQTQNYVARDSRAIDLIKERKRLSRFKRQTVHSDLTVGLPAAVHLVDDLHLWQMFFDSLGIKTITSESYEEALKVGKKLSQSEFCAPMTAMHGHARWLLDRTDFLFMPIYLENKTKDARRQYCYYTQFLPSLIAGISEHDEPRVLRPVIRYLYTSFHTKIQLYRMLQRIRPGKWSFLDVTSAYDRAVDFDRQYRQELKVFYDTRMAEKKQSDISVVLVGRPYTLFSPALNGNIPGIFKNMGVDTYYQDMLSIEPEDVDTLRPLLQEIHWEHAANTLEAAEAVAGSEGVYPVYVTSFKCSPDSFALEYFKTIMDRHNKPYLILELDGHDSNVGYETRIEAAIRAFRNHHENHLPFLPIYYNTLNLTYSDSLAGKHVLFPNWDHMTCSFLTATLKREGYDAHLLEESDQIIRESLKHNSGQCIPLNVVAQCCISYINKHHLDPARCVLWLNRSYLGCNIRLYPHYIRQIFIQHGGGMAEVSVYQGDISFSDISVKACINAYFSFMIGGMLRKVACKIRPYEIEPGRTDKILKKSIKVLTDAFAGKRSIEKTLGEVVSHFDWIETSGSPRPKVAIFGDLYSRDNEVMNQDLIRYIEANGGEVITTPYHEYAKMIAKSYIRKWFNEGKYFDVLTSRALLTAMNTMEKSYARIFHRILDTPLHTYDDDPAEILGRYNISVENTGESMDNIMKIHYIKKYYPDVALLVQASPALCCASLITEAMKTTIENITGIPVVSITYDGTGGSKNDLIIPYLKYPRMPNIDKNQAPAFNRVS